MGAALFFLAAALGFVDEADALGADTGASSSDSLSSEEPEVAAAGGEIVGAFDLP